MLTRLRRTGLGEPSREGAAGRIKHATVKDSSNERAGRSYERESSQARTKTEGEREMGSPLAINKSKFRGVNLQLGHLARVGFSFSSLSSLALLQLETADSRPTESAAAPRRPTGCPLPPPTLTPTTSRPFSALSIPQNSLDLQPPRPVVRSSPSPTPNPSTARSQGQEGPRSASAARRAWS